MNATDELVPVRRPADFTEDMEIRKAMQIRQAGLNYATKVCVVGTHTPEEILEVARKYAAYLEHGT